MKLFLKGIIVGIGAIAPGLSGSLLLVVLGLYEKVINSITTLFKNFKKNLLFLIPLGIGILLGIVTFSRLISFVIENYEIQTRLAFFGLLIGTIPLFYREVKKNNDLNKKHFLLMGIAFILGVCVLLSPSIGSTENINIFQSFLLGFIGIGATIVPGVSGTAVLSVLGLYDNWLDLTSLNDIVLSIYIPAGIGVVIGGFLLLFTINKLLKKNYTATFSVLFGFFLSIIPGVLRCSAGNYISLANNSVTYIGAVLFIVGIFLSYLFTRLSKE